MPVKNSKETYLRPFQSQVSLALRLEDVKNDRDSVFIILSDNALVSISSIRLDQSTFFLRCLGGLMVFE